MADIFDSPEWGQGLPDVFNTSAGFGTGSTYDTPRHEDTVTSNALQSMQPVETVDTGWTSFFRDITKGIVGYSIQKDAVQSGVYRPAVPGQYQGQPGGQPGQVYRQPINNGGGGGGGGNLLTLLILGGLVLALKR